MTPEEIKWYLKLEQMKESGDYKEPNRMWIGIFIDNEPPEE